VLTLISRARIDCLLDVGAHWGEYGRLLRDSGYTGEIVSFEPVSANVERLAERSAGDDRWTHHRVALGRTAGSLEINVNRETDTSSFLEPTAYGQTRFADAVALESRETVEVRRLDELLESCVDRPQERRFFLKLDTQGWDLEVLAGASGCLDRVFGVQSELSVKPIYEGMPTYLDALAALGELGFELTGVFPVTRDSRLQIVELDGVLVRPDAW
jgi:FkbM family methyltransferase